MNLLLAAALTSAVWALWSRRAAIGRQWEGAPTLMIGSAAIAAYLTSSIGKTGVDQAWHELTGRWNDGDLLGYFLGTVCCAAAVYMCLARLGDAEMVQEFYHRRVTQPLSVVLPLIVAAFELGPAGETHIGYLEDLEEPIVSWSTVGWFLYCATNVYLLLLAARLAWQLRQSQRTVVDMYLASFFLTVAFFVVLFVHVVSNFDLRSIAWACSYSAVVLFAITPAYSWRLKTRKADPVVRVPLGVILST